MTVFERIVRVRPAYDCLMVQPCVHGSAQCGTVLGKSHGRHNAEMHIVLKGAVAEVILGISTGWDLPETPDSVRSDRGPRGLFVEFHSAVSRYEGAEMQRSTCDTWPGGCYGDVGYTMADEPAELLVRKGLDAVWEWLEAAYAESFGDRKAATR